MVGVADNIRGLLGQSMHNWKTELISNGDALDEISIQGGIFQGNSLSPLPFIIILILLSMNSTNYGYLRLKETPINNILLMHDQKLYGKTERELQSLVHTVRIISKDTGMEFGMDKYSTARIRKGKMCDMEDKEMPYGQRMKQIAKSGCKYPGFIKNSKAKTHVTEDKIRTEYLMRVRKLAQ